MSDIECEICGSTFKRPGNLQYHLDNNVCQGNSVEQKQKLKQYRCKYCGKPFTTATSMYRHANHTCKIKKKEENKRDEIFERLIKLEEDNKRLVRLENENKTLKKKLNGFEKRIQGSNMINNGIINNGDISMTNVIVNNYIVAYGQEDPSKIDKMKLLNAFRCGFNSTLKLTETMHFNPDYPEYHNVYISSMKNKHAMMYDGNDWTLVMKDDLIDKLYDDKRNYIEENLDDFLDSLTGSQKNALYRWMDADDDHDYIKKIKNDIKLLLYNKRKLPINSKNVLEIDGGSTNILDRKTGEVKKSTTSTASKKKVKKMNKGAGRPGTKRKCVRAVKSGKLFGT
jgi:Zinc finger, C2H2 type